MTSASISGAEPTSATSWSLKRIFRGAKVVKLEQNYRSTGNILAAAHSVIQNNRGRKAKKLWTDAQEGHKIIYRRADDEKEEAYYIAQEIDRLRSSYDGYNDFAVLAEPTPNPGTLKRHCLPEAFPIGWWANSIL